jgi:redox-sensing transcriptional repressor
MSELAGIVEKLDVRIGVIAVPPGSGQAVADQMIDAGIKGILNFSPVKLTAPEKVFIRNVNLSIAMESLSYSLSKGKKLKPF